MNGNESILPFHRPGEGDSSDHEEGEQDQVLRAALKRQIILTARVGDLCHDLAKDVLLNNKVERAVVFVCRVGDRFAEHISLVFGIDLTQYSEHDYVCFVRSLEEVESCQPNIYLDVLERMIGTFGYFAIVIVSYAGYNVLPWPYKRKIDKEPTVYVLPYMST